MALHEKTSVNVTLGVLVSAGIAWAAWMSSAVIEIKERVAKIEGKLEPRSAAVSDHPTLAKHP